MASAVDRTVVLDDVWRLADPHSAAERERWADLIDSRSDVPVAERDGEVCWTERAAGMPVVSYDDWLRRVADMDAEMQAAAGGERALRDLTEQLPLVSSPLLTPAQRWRGNGGRP
jgi:hypothetical protein